MIKGCLPILVDFTIGGIPIKFCSLYSCTILSLSSFNSCSAGEGSGYPVTQPESTRSFQVAVTRGLETSKEFGWRWRTAFQSVRASCRFFARVFRAQQTHSLTGWTSKSSSHWSHNIECEITQIERSRPGKLIRRTYLVNNSSVTKPIHLGSRHVPLVLKVQLKRSVSLVFVQPLCDDPVNGQGHVLEAFSIERLEFSRPICIRAYHSIRPEWGLHSRRGNCSTRRSRNTKRITKR